MDRHAPVTTPNLVIDRPAFMGAVSGAGFTLETISECPPVKDLLIGERAEYERRLQVPVFLLIGGAVAV